MNYFLIKIITLFILGCILYRLSFCTGARVVFIVKYKGVIEKGIYILQTKILKKVL